MKIFLDNIVFTLQSAGGISSYWGELCKRIENANPYFNVTFIENKESIENVVRKEIALKTESIRYEKSLLLNLHRFKRLNLCSDQPAVFHSSYNRSAYSGANIQQVITVHDFVHEKYYGGIRKTLHSMQKSQTIKKSQHIIAISENTKRDLMHYMPEIDESKISVIYNGVSNDFYPLKREGTERERPFLLFVGSREHYKNFFFCVDLIKELNGFDFYIVGSALSEKEIIYLENKINKRWKLFEKIDNSFLNVLYNEAFCLLYPSFYEGFGLPVLEAMRCGTPVIALNSSSIPEVAGDAGVLIDELNIEAFIDGIQYVDKFKDKLRELGIANSKKFSWDMCCQQTFNIYESLL